MSDPRQPRLLQGRYQVGALLGYGQTAEVYHGRDLRLGRDVAIKMPRADLARDETVQLRFRREEQNQASLHHPTIVAVYDTGVQDGPAGEQLPYIVMEFVNGRTLDEVLRHERLEPRRTLEIVAEICAALDNSHRRGIIHRDIRPGNIMLTQTGRVKLFDFGSARVIATSDPTSTQESLVIGEARYISPEQARGEVADARSDVYSIGCVLFEMLCGRPPFIGDSPITVAYQHIRENPHPPSFYSDDVTSDIDAIVLKALAKDPANRYQRAHDMGIKLLGKSLPRPRGAGTVYRSAAGPKVLASDWAARQAQSLGGPAVGAGEQLPAEVRIVLTGLVLLAQAGVHVGSGLLRDLVQVTGGGEPVRYPAIAALRSHPGVRRLRALRWPPSARVAFAALLLDGLPVEDAWRAPSVPAVVLFGALVDALAVVGGEEAAGDAPLASLQAAADRITDRTVTLLTIVGSGAAAADPVLALRMRHEAPDIPALSVPQRTLLESFVVRPPQEVRNHTVSTVAGPGTVGVSRRGKLTSLLPTQLALPPQVLLHRYASRSALYRLHEADADAPIEPVTLLLDTSPATFGPIEAVLRIVAHAITVTLWSAQQVPLLVCLDRPDLTLPLNRPSDLAAVWSRRSLQPPSLNGALARSGPGKQPCVLLTEHHLAADHGLIGTPHLRLVTTRLGPDTVSRLADGPHQAHLGPEPTAAQLAAAVSIVLAPEGP